MKFLKVLWSDIRNISKSKFLKMTIIAITLLPLAYGGLYLAAFWDPYGKTETLPVAVVNLDSGGEREDVRVKYGDDVVDGLRNNDDLGWRFVKTLKEAEEGLEGDDYYAMLVIPKDFTERVLDVENGKLRKPKVIFKANKKKNYVVGLITDKASTAIEKQIREKAGSKFTEIVVDSLEDVRDGLELATDATYLMKDGVTELKDKVPSLTNALDKIHDGSSTLNEKLGDAKDGSSKLMEGVGALKGKMPELLDGIDRLGNATSMLNENVSDAYDGSVLLRNGASGLYDKLPDLSDGVDQIHDGSQSLSEGIGQVNDKMPDLIDGVKKLKDGAAQLDTGLKTAADSVKLLYDKDEEGNVKKDAGLPAIKNGSDKMRAKISLGIMDKLYEKDGNIRNIDKLCGGFGQIVGGINSLDGIIKSGKVPISEESVEKWQKDAVDMRTLNNLFNILRSEDATDEDKSIALLRIAFILNGDNLDVPVDRLQEIAMDLKEMAMEIEKIPNYNIPNYEKVPQIKALHDIHDALVKLSMGTSGLNKQLSELKTTLAMYQGISAISAGLGQASEGVGGLVEGLDALYQGSNKLYKGLDSLYDNTRNLQDGIGLLYTGSKDLTNGADKFQSTVPVLTNGIAQLTDGTIDLSDGLFKLNKGTETLTDKVGELNQKAPDMEEGVHELYDGSSELTNGLSKLIDGSAKLTDGVSALQGKMPDLQDGVDRLYEGTATLNDSLGKGAEKVSDKLVRSSKTMGDFVGDPIKLDDEPIVEVDKYGLGLSPYFVSLGLWVGALMMFFVVGGETGKDINNVRPASVVLGKYVFCCIIGAFQAILLSLAVMKLGLRPTNIPAYIGFNIFLSCVFIAVAQNLIFLFGDVGKLGVVLMLLLQLTSSGGTFPRELLPTFFDKVNPFLPFTYSISGLREISWGIDPHVLRKDIAILGGVLVAFLTMSIILKRYTDKFQGNVSIEHQKEISLEEETIDTPSNTISQ